MIGETNLAIAHAIRETPDAREAKTAVRAALIRILPADFTHNYSSFPPPASNSATERIGHAPRRFNEA